MNDMKHKLYHCAFAGIAAALWATFGPGETVDWQLRACAVLAGYFWSAFMFD